MNIQKIIHDEKNNINTFIRCVIPLYALEPSFKEEHPCFTHSTYGGGKWRGQFRGILIVHDIVFKVLSR